LRTFEPYLLAIQYSHKTNHIVLSIAFFGRVCSQEISYAGFIPLFYKRTIGGRKLRGVRGFRGFRRFRRLRGPRSSVLGEAGFE
jgi:hypothetical protein